MNPSLFHFEITGQGGGRHQMSLPANRRITIGRDDASDVVLFAAHVSRKHAFVELTPGGLQITDTSRNGTLANGVPLKRGSRVFTEPRVTLLLGYIHIQISLEEPEFGAQVSSALREAPTRSEVRRASTAPPPDSEPKK